MLLIYVEPSSSDVAYCACRVVADNDELVKLDRIGKERHVEDQSTANVMLMNLLRTTNHFI